MPRFSKGTRSCLQLAGEKGREAPSFSWASVGLPFWCQGAELLTKGPALASSFQEALCSVLLPHPRFRATLFSSEGNFPGIWGHAGVGAAGVFRAQPSRQGQEVSPRLLPGGKAPAPSFLLSPPDLSGAAKPAVSIPTLLQACVLAFSALPRPLHPGCTHIQTPIHTQLTKPRQHAHTHGHTPTQLPTSIRPTHTPTCTHRCTHTYPSTHIPPPTHTPGALPPLGSVPPPHVSSPWWCWHLCYRMYVSRPQPLSSQSL